MDCSASGNHSEETNKRQLKITEKENRKAGGGEGGVSSLLYRISGANRIDNNLQNKTSKSISCWRDKSKNLIAKEHSTAQHSPVQSAQYSTAHHNTVQHNMVQYRTIFGRVPKFSRSTATTRVFFSGHSRSSTSVV